jgi:hypothetical protein
MHRHSITRQSRLRPTLVAAALGAAAVATAALGAAPTPSAFAPPAWPTGGPAAVAASDPVHPLNLGRQRVVLEVTELSDLRNTIGAGAVVHQGDGTETLSFLCYTVADAAQPQRLWFTSSELAGNHRIDGIVATELAPGSAPAPQCPDLPAQFLPLRFDDGLWLGMLSSEQKRAYAVALQRGTPWSASFHDRHGSLDVLGSLAIDIRKGRAVGIFVAHASAN